MLEQDIDPETMSEAESRMKWLTHNGKDILYEDYTNLTGEQIARLVPAITKITEEKDYKDILLLLDFTNSFANKEATNAFGESGKVSKDRLKKTAVLGITGVKKVLLNFVNRVSKVDAKPFSSEEDAKEWLIS
jgi:hypothetical protein